MFTKRISKRLFSTKRSAFAHINSFNETVNKSVGTSSFVKYRERIYDRFNSADDETKQMLLPFYRATNWNDVIGVFRRIDQTNNSFFAQMEEFVSETIEECVQRAEKENMAALGLVFVVPTSFLAAALWINSYLY